MATAVADLEAVETGDSNPALTSAKPAEAPIPPEYVMPRRLMARLEVMANKRNWSISEALARSLNVAEIVLDANDDPTTKIYIHQQGARYRLNIPQ